MFFSYYIRIQFFLVSRSYLNINLITKILNTKKKKTGKYLNLLIVKLNNKVLYKEIIFSNLLLKNTIIFILIILDFNKNKDIFYKNPFLNLDIIEYQLNIYKKLIYKYYTKFNPVFIQIKKKEKKLVK